MSSSIIAFKKGYLTAFSFWYGQAIAADLIAAAEFNFTRTTTVHQAAVQTLEVLVASVPLAILLATQTAVVKRTMLVHRIVLPFFLGGSPPYYSLSVARTTSYAL